MITSREKFWIAFLLIGGLAMVFAMNRLSPEYQSKKNFEDCMEKIKDDPDMDCKRSAPSNHTAEVTRYTVYNKTKERIESELRQKEQAEREACYNSGKDIHLSFDIKDDYGYSCEQLAYINDHFIDQTDRLDSGYINYLRDGFFSDEHLNVQLYDYVTERVLATGQLVQSINYHLDCNDSKSGETVEYWSESKFVMYYVENCLK